MSKEKVALITGSARGIGRAIAVRLAKEGINIAVNYVFSEEQAKDTVSICKREGIEAVSFRADISHTTSRNKLVDSVKRYFGRLDILVNNAGVAPKKRTDILEATEESFDEVIAINLKGPYFLTQVVSQWMIEQKSNDPDREPLIINISSISSYTSSTNRGEYCISKAGVSMATKLYADRLAEYGIHVYEVMPGIIRTDMTKGASEKYDRLFGEGITPIARWGKPEDVANAVAGFVMGLYKYSTGDVIQVDGGFHLRRL